MPVSDYLSSSLPGRFTKLSIAPMIDWTNTHFRVLLRILAPNALLYTEMQTVGAIVNNPQRALQFHAIEKPLVLQIGGSNPGELAKCALLAEQQGFAEINLNLGCPSDRVQAGRFGACLMAEPKHAALCLAAMKEVVSIPVTAKTRIGIDHEDSYDFFASFVDELINAGCDKLVVHARKAWLKGLNPKQNRTIPPLHYEYVYRIKKSYPDIPVIINGNIETKEAIQSHLAQVDGVMIGRLACQNPYAIAEIHHDLFPKVPLISRQEVLQRYTTYMCAEAQKGVPLTILLKPILNLAHGLTDAKRWKTEFIDYVKRGEWENCKI